MANQTKRSRRGGSHEDHVRAGRAGGEATARQHRNDNFYQRIGSKGGKVSPGNFKNDPQRASEAGQRGGRARSSSSDDIM